LDTISLFKFNQLDAIFFDFDDVLAESLDIKAKAFLSLFQGQSQSIIQQIETYFYQYTGRSRQEKIKYVHSHILKKPINSSDIKALSNLFGQRSLAAVINCPEIRGTTELLSSLPCNLKSFVVSGTPEDDLIEIVTARGLCPYFDAIRGTPTRKELQISQLLRQYQLNAGKCLMVGDGLVDHLAARINGMPFIGVVARGKVNHFKKGVTTVRDMEMLQSLLRVDDH